EINEAAVIVHVLDVTHPNAVEQADTVNRVLEELGADGKPTIVALNKIDRLGAAGLPTLEQVPAALPLPPDVVPISALEGIGLSDLLARIDALLAAERDFVPVTLRVPYDRTDLVDRFHRHGRVDEL